MRAGDLTLTRRGAVLGMAAVGTGLALARPARADVAGKSIAVIGAGMAGLAAAGALARLGADVTVYEARARIGGRIFTSRLWSNFPCDLGASWIHGPRGNPLSKLAKAAGAAMVQTRYDSAAAFAGGHQINNDADPWALAEAAHDLANDLPKDISLQAALMRLPQMKGQSRAQKDRLAATIHLGIEHEYGGDWRALSARYFDLGHSFGGEDVLFAQGYDALVEYAARGLDIRTGAEVTRLRARAAGVEIGFAAGQTITADGAIVTLPLGVLQAADVTFDPPLAPARQAAVGALGMGLLNKVFLRFDTLPATPAVDWLEKLDAPYDSFPEWVNLAHVLGVPALLGFNAAASADAFEARSDAGTIAAATEALRAMFGSAFPAPLDAQITRWRADRFARGSYSFHAVGAAQTARADLGGADWDGRIAFAGEACSRDHPSTVHGAWLSGLDAADALLT